MNDLVKALQVRHPDMDEAKAKAIGDAIVASEAASPFFRTAALSNVRDMRIEAYDGVVRAACTAYAAGVKAGRIEGFMGSAEGFNGEYPFEDDVEKYKQHLAARSDRP